MAPIPACESMLPLLYLSSRSIIEAASGKTFEDGPSTSHLVHVTHGVVRYCDGMMQIYKKKFDIDQEPTR